MDPFHISVVRKRKSSKVGELLVENRNYIKKNIALITKESLIKKHFLFNANLIKHKMAFHIGSVNKIKIIGVYVLLENAIFIFLLYDFMFNSMLLHIKFLKMKK